MRWRHETGAAYFPPSRGGARAPMAAPCGARSDVHFPTPVLQICIPVYNEAPTVGVLLWRIRKVLQEFPREYEIVVYDDGSTDATAETLAPYGRVLPLTVLRGEAHRGYAAALDALLRAASRRTRYPRRDAIVVMQADFTDQPEHLPELVKRFEGGADLVVAERSAEERRRAPVPVRRLQTVAPWVIRPFVAVPGVRDPFGAYRLYRVSVVRDLVKAQGDRPLVAADGWAANLELLLRTAGFARRVETLELPARYDVRPRDSRVRPWADALNLYRFGRAERAMRRATPPAPEPVPAGTNS
jgi:glycosyltransferase involved in cell wall biosynthesis